MLTRIEIDGFKTFEDFNLDLSPFTAIVGPNASGKSNLFDALRFLSLLAQFDIRTAMQDLRGQPEELFRQTSAGIKDKLKFAIEVLLDETGTDAFGTTYVISAQRLRYELELSLILDIEGHPKGVFVSREHCRPISKMEDSAPYLRHVKINYNARISPFIRLNDAQDAIEVRQDGRQKHGRPVSLSLHQASRTALSTISTAEFPHLYALRGLLTHMRFLEINPNAARNANDRFEERILKPDASNLSAVLARLKDETGDDIRPNGILSDIAADLASLIPSVSELQVQNDQRVRQFSFSIGFTGELSFSSRVISDGTIRLLALLTVLNDPDRRGSLCFEEPENGVHEGRIPTLVRFLRDATTLPLKGKLGSPAFQIIINTHSPAVMHALLDSEIVAADTVTTLDPKSKSRSGRTRMRIGIQPTADLVNPETHLTRTEVEKLLRAQTDAA
jgi:predicted ATPase